MADLEREAARKAIILALFDDLRNGRGVEQDRIAQDYRPHCAPLEGVPVLEPGAEALGRRLRERGRIPHLVYRSIADGDYVWTHARFDGAVPIAGIDIFRFDEDDRIAEHWNVRQVAPHDAEQGWDRFAGDADTETVIGDERREEMKELLVRSQREVWGQARADLVPFYYDEGYVQHNPDMPGGRERIRHLVATEMKDRLERTGQPFPIDFHLVGANGDVVFIYYSIPMAGIGRKAEERSRNADIFRIDARNKLIEHWDVLQMGSEPLPDERSLF